MVSSPLGHLYCLVVFDAFINRGSIVIYPKDENEMTNTERLRHLQGFIVTEPPERLSHLRHEPTTYGNQVLPDYRLEMTTTS
ncbi:MAG: hypothetical protein WA667_09780 [Candidatus Nitrosopolaris sp.]